MAETMKNKLTYLPQLRYREITEMKLITYLPSVECFTASVLKLKSF